jgi:hypothetical protein
MKYLLYIAVLVSLTTYLFWSYLPKGGFYIGNSLFILLLCTYLFINDKSSFVKFILLSLSLNNFFDEIFFDNTEFGLNEIVVGVVILIFAIIRNYVRKRPNDTKGTNRVLF